jgi:hypothetical protein
LAITLSSSAFTSELNIKGPTIGRRNKSIGFVIEVPYSPVVNDPEPLNKLTNYFRKGMMQVLTELDYSRKALEEINNIIK